MRKRIILLTMIAILAVGIECLAQTKTAYYNGGTVTYTLRRIGNASQDAGEATTGYDNPGYIQFASVFGYDKSGNVVSSASNSDAASAYAKTKVKKSVAKYKTTHVIKDSNNTPLIKYSLEG